MGPSAPVGLTTRPLVASDLDEVVRIDALHTGKAKPDYWERVFAAFLDPDPARDTFGFGVAEGDGLVGYILGEVRAVEFGSDPCGWVFAIGVEESHARKGLASALLDAACRHFRTRDVTQVRTMVSRTDVPVLSFFRAGGFVGGPFVQLELDLDEPARGDA